MDADLIVIGAGQSGLAAAFAAESTGEEVVVLEGSDALGGSWASYYDSLRLFSPARYSALPWRPFPGGPDRYPRRDEVVDYLTACAGDLGAEIRLGHQVASVAVEPGMGFAVRSTNGTELRASRLIAASGSFGAPYRPRLPGLETFSGQVLHASEYRSPDSVEGERIVVVGAGNSAVQIAVELASSAQVTLASRSDIRWAPQRPLGRDLHWWLTHSGVDSAPIGRWLARKPPVLDDGSQRQALIRGRPDRRPLFERLDGDNVVWTDGSREPIDVLLLATGYRPHLPCLAGTGSLDPDGMPVHRDGVSVSVPGLGFVGLEHQRSIASATLRGVGRDARRVVRRLRHPTAPDRRRSPTCCAASVLR
jgi:putative flavoprotein involved in K+ transport